MNVSEDDELSIFIISYISHQIQKLETKVIRRFPKISQSQTRPLFRRVLLGGFNQEKAIVGAFSRYCENFGNLRLKLYYQCSRGAVEAFPVNIIFAATTRG